MLRRRRTAPEDLYVLVRCVETCVAGQNSRTSNLSCSGGISQRSFKTARSPTTTQLAIAPQANLQLKSSDLHRIEADCVQKGVSRHLICSVASDVCCLIRRRGILMNPFEAYADGVG